MKKYTLLFIIILFFMSCRNIAQPMSIPFKIDTVSDIKKGVNEKSSRFIKNRLEQLIGKSAKEKCQKQQITYPPKFVVFRAFKLEMELEIWAANKRKDKLKLIAKIPICAVDNEPGPKLFRGDGKTPEGFYKCGLYYGSRMDFMWIKLNNKEIKKYGDVGYGSSFKICLNYPNRLDIKRSNSIKKGNSPGSEICLHGNCVTAGCLSFINENFLPVFLFASFHNQKKYGMPDIYIYPFRFTNELKNKYIRPYAKTKKKKILELWENLEESYKLFEKEKHALKINKAGKKYSFGFYK